MGQSGGGVLKGKGQSVQKCHFRSHVIDVSVQSSQW